MTGTCTPVSENISQTELLVHVTDLADAFTLEFMCSDGQDAAVVYTASDTDTLCVDFFLAKYHK